MKAAQDPNRTGDLRYRLGLCRLSYLGDVMEARTSPGSGSVLPVGAVGWAVRAVEHGSGLGHVESDGPGVLADVWIGGAPVVAALGARSFDAAPLPLLAQFLAAGGDDAGLHAAAPRFPRSVHVAEPISNTRIGPTATVVFATRHQ